MKRTAKDIVQILRTRHRGDEWACFEEFRCGTGYGRRTGDDTEKRIDLLAVNLWPSKRMADGTPRIVAYEVKVSHSDFMKELDNPGKRAAAERRATDCYFAAPTGVIRPEEVPDPWGLIVVGDKGVRVTKATTQRSIDPWDWGFCCSMARRSADEKQGGPTKAWMYAGRELTVAELRQVAIDAFRENSKTACDVAVAEFKAGPRMQSLRNLKHAVRAVVGWNNATAEGFDEWLAGQESGIDDATMRHLRIARTALDKLLGDLE